MNIYFGGRTRRRRLVLPAWWYHRCSVPGCTVPLWPPSDLEDRDPDGYDMRSDEMQRKHLSFSQVCFKCDRIFCRYHLSPPIDFAESWSDSFIDDCFQPPVARLCTECIYDTDIEFIEWLHIPKTPQALFRHHERWRKHRRRFSEE